MINNGCPCRLEIGWLEDKSGKETFRYILFSTSLILICINILPTPQNSEKI